MNRRIWNSDQASPRASRRAREQAQRRADMLAAAATVFAHKGHDGAQMAEIAATAEVSLASLYAEFRGKDEIFGAVVDAAAQRMFRTLRERVDPVQEPGEALLVLIDAFFECLDQDRAVVRLVMSGSAGVPWRIRANRHGGIADEVTAWATAICRKATRRAAPLRGLDGSILAHALMGAVLHAAAHAVDHEPERPLAELAPRVRAIFARLLDGSAR